MQIKDPIITNGYKDPSPRRHYRMLQAIYHKKELYISPIFKSKLIFSNTKTQIYFQIST